MIFMFCRLPFHLMEKNWRLVAVSSRHGKAGITVFGYGIRSPGMKSLATRPRILGRSTAWLSVLMGDVLPQVALTIGSRWRTLKQGKSSAKFIFERVQIFHS